MKYPLFFFVNESLDFQIPPGQKQTYHRTFTVDKYLPTIGDCPIISVHNSIFVSFKSGCLDILTNFLGKNKQERSPWFSCHGRSSCCHYSELPCQQSWLWKFDSCIWTSSIICWCQVEFKEVRYSSRVWWNWVNWKIMISLFVNRLLLIVKHFSINIINKKLLQCPKSKLNIFDTPPMISQSPKTNSEISRWMRKKALSLSLYVCLGYSFHPIYRLLAHRLNPPSSFFPKLDWLKLDSHFSFQKACCQEDDFFSYKNKRKRLSGSGFKNSSCFFTIDCCRFWLTDWKNMVDSDEEVQAKRVTLDEALIEEWKNEPDIENILETLKDVNAFLVHKYGSPKFPKFSVAILKVCLFILSDVRFVEVTN